MGNYLVDVEQPKADIIADGWQRESDLITELLREQQRSCEAELPVPGHAVAA
jgi:hypothetical protein